MTNNKLCKHCGASFSPKEMAYNSKFCSKKCREKARSLRSVRIYNVDKRNQDYLKIKNDAEKYAKHLNNSLIAKRKARNWLAEYKTSRGCIDCGYNHHFAALQLDHEGTKTAEISDIRYSKKKLLAEIESGKCVVRCAICHSVRTWAQKNKLEYDKSMSFPLEEK